MIIIIVRDSAGLFSKLVVIDFPPITTTSQMLGSSCVSGNIHGLILFEWVLSLIRNLFLLLPTYVYQYCTLGIIMPCWSWMWFISVTFESPTDDSWEYDNLQVFNTKSSVGYN